VRPAVVVAAAVVVLATARLWRRHRAGSARVRTRRLRSARPSSQTRLVAAREIRERVRARAFHVVTAIVLAAVAAAIVIPALTRGTSRPERVGVVGSLSGAQRRAMTLAASSTGARLELAPEASLEAAVAALRRGRIDLALRGGREVLVDRAPAATDASTPARFVHALAADLGLEEAVAAAHLTPDQAARIAGARPLPIRGLAGAPPPATGSRGPSLVGVVIVFVMLSQYETWTLIGVMEEKSSRVAKVLLATVRPAQLLGGKVLGIGVVALAQASAILAFAFVLAEAVGSDLLRGTAPTMLAAALLWLVVGYAFYCWVYAAAGSLAERQDQIQTLALPLSLPMVFGYVMALTGAASGHASVLLEVLAYLPPTAPFAMPVLVALKAVSWWGFVGAVACSVVATVWVARLAATVYRRAVLRTGRRVRLGEVLGTRRGR